jgi:cell division transport system ATP-binding protein
MRTPSSAAAAVDLSHASKRYAGSSRYALKDVTLRIEPGEFVFLTGPSGSGKSTLIRLCLREETLTSGRLAVLGQDVAALSARQVPYLRRHCGAVFQDYRLLPALTVTQNIAFALEAIGQDDRTSMQRVAEAVELVGLEHRANALPGQLSGGEAQRAAIARALVTRPSILLADEPTGNLDPESSEGIVKLLEVVHHCGTTTVVATHDSALVDRAQRRVIRLEAGEVVADAVGGYRVPAGPARGPGRA